MNKVASIPDNVFYLHRTATSPVTIGSNYCKKPKKKDIFWTQVIKNPVINNSPSNKKCIQIKNNPISEVELLDHRRVIVHKNYAVEVDKDFTLDAMLSSKIEGGKFNGEFVWCLIGTKLKLVRIGSDLHNHVLDCIRRSKLPKIKKKDFEVGGIYSTPSGKTEMYLGKVNTEYCFVDYKVNKIRNEEHKNKHLFYKVYNTEFDNIEQDISNIRPYNLNIKNTHSFVEKVKNVSLSSDIISRIREAAVKNMRSMIADSHENKNWVLSEYRYNSHIINMHLSTEPPPPKFDIQKYITFM